MLAAGVLLTSAVAQAAQVLSLGPGRGYDNGNLFQLVMTGHSMDTLRAMLASDGHTFTPGESFTSAALANREVILLGLFHPGQGLTAAEQTAILNFVRSGGALIYMGDNDRFSSSNISVAGIFGVTYSNEPTATTASQVIDGNHPIMNGPAGVVHMYDGTGNVRGFFGGIDRLGPHAKALLGTGERTVVAVIERNKLQAGSGPVVFLSDVNGFMDADVGGINRGDNAKLFRNIFAWIAPSSDGCNNANDCNDGLFCNGVEQCVDGVCKDGMFPCSNGLGCHENTDSCAPCTNNSQCNDGLFCNGIETCDQGVCKPGTFPCTGGQGCDERDDTCGPCSHSSQCDDGIFCNGLEVCVGQTCIPGSFPCHPGEGCHEDQNTCGPCTNDLQCDDGLFCNGVETCLAGVCQRGTFPCAQGDGCDESANRCGPCGPTSSCNDFIFCNGMETCVGGVCQPSEMPCAGGLICDEAAGECRPCANDGECDDGLFCTGVEHCNTGTGRCDPGQPPCAGLICEEDDDECAKVSLALVTLPVPSQMGVANELPVSQGRFNNGATVFAEVWAQTSHEIGLGCVYADMTFGEPGCPLFGGSIVHQSGFNAGASGAFVGNSLVNEFGGCGTSGGLGVAPMWQRIGHVALSGSDMCNTEICLTQAYTPTTNFSGGVIPADLISYDCRTIELADCIYDLDGDDFVGPGDLALFAACWLCCSGDPCWQQNKCTASDFDCDTCVGPGDLAYFATAWLMECADANIIAPPCQSTAGVILPPADEDLIRQFNLEVPPRGWPTTRRDWYEKMREMAVQNRLQLETQMIQGP